MAERILIVGAGMAGLATALALGRTGCEVTLVERDGPPPDLPPDALLTDWQRPGALQLRHSHGFFGRLRNLLQGRYPDLYQQLLAAGAREVLGRAARAHCGQASERKVRPNRGGLDGLAHPDRSFESWCARTTEVPLGEPVPTGA